MSRNEQAERLKSFYENEGIEELRLREGGTQYLEYLTAVKYLDKYLPRNARVLDTCAGSGAYAFYLAGGGHRVTAGDIVPFNVKCMEKKQAANPVLEQLYTGDTRELSRFTDGSFDAVLCMGALYHLDEAADRAKSVGECLRVLREGGVFVCTYMNRYAVILGNCRGSLDNIGEVLAFAEDGREGIFYAAAPREIEELADNAGLRRLCHLTLDGMSDFMYSAGLLNTEGLERWREYHFATCEVESLLGCGYHNMLIGEKI